MLIGSAGWTTWSPRATTTKRQNIIVFCQRNLVRVGCRWWWMSIRFLSLAPNGPNSVTLPDLHRLFLYWWPMGKTDILVDLLILSVSKTLNILMLTGRCCRLWLFLSLAFERKTAAKHSTCSPIAIDFRSHLDEFLNGWRFRYRLNITTWSWQWRVFVPKRVFLPP